MEGHSPTLDVLSLLAAPNFVRVFPVHRGARRIPASFYVRALLCRQHDHKFSLKTAKQPCQVRAALDVAVLPFVLLRCYRNGVRDEGNIRRKLERIHNRTRQNALLLSQRSLIDSCILHDGYRYSLKLTTRPLLSRTQAAEKEEKDLERVAPSVIARSFVTIFRALPNPPFGA